VLLRDARVALDRYFGGFVETSGAPASQAWLRCVPALPRLLRRTAKPLAWPPPRIPTPHALRTYPGIRRDPVAQDRAFADQPLHDYFKVHHENMPLATRHAWHFVLPTAPAMSRALHRSSQLHGARPRTDAAARKRVRELDDPAAFTQAIRAEAAALGIGAIGFTAYDARYTYAEFAGTHDEGTVIVCLVEQDWQATDTAPSARAERAAFVAYADLMQRVSRLGEFVERQGVRAHVHTFVGESLTIPYAVEAGLGQLGMNGQLLSPAVGSRARLSIITTDSLLVHDRPVDYGVNAICDACQACVRRCPVGAIPNRRTEHRGVTKVKIKTERCFPVVIQADGCAVCMKVCPVARYGLAAVHEHYVKTGGEILGRDSDELEGYVWPVDGRYYGPGEKPGVQARRRLLENPHLFPVDPDRPAPLAGRAVG
jgi:epoxyqueuosine reductase QueG